MIGKVFSRRRRTLVKNLVAMIALRPVAAFAALSRENTVALLEPVHIPRSELADGSKIVEFEAWFRLDGANRLVGGLLLDLDGIAGLGARESALVAFVTNCPHEACKVLLERHPEAVVDRLGTDIEVPDGPILFCPCHFSIFDPSRDGSRLAGPAYRGLYRFVLEEHRSSIVVSRVEQTVADLFR